MRLTKATRPLRRMTSWLARRGQALARALFLGDAMPPEMRHLVWNTKVMGSVIARQMYEAGIAGPAVPPQPYPVLVRLSSRICRQQDLEAPWLHHWCSRLGMYPLYHRKVWEDCFVLQAMWEAGMLARRRRGLGFAVGQEALPAFFAAQGAEVLATDLAPSDARARKWRATGQHVGEASRLHHPRLIDDKTFKEKVSFRPVDMAKIPPDLMKGEFDFLWSVCSFEHLGSIEAGLDFVVKAMACLRPGGLAVHTTEFNLAAEGPTLDHAPTVLYQRRHIEQLAQRLAAEGHEMRPVDFDTGSGVLDRFVDLPPFSGKDRHPLVPDTPHLRLAFREHVATSIGLIIRARS